MPFLTSQRLGLASVIGGALGFPVALLLGASYLATSEGAEEPPIVAWDEAFREAVPAAFDFAGPDGVYLTYGRFTPLVFLGFLAGLWGLHRFQASPEARAERTTFFALFGLQALFTLGVTVAYFTPFLDQAFILMILSLLLSLIAYVVYGVITVRRNVVPRDVGWFLIVSPLLWLPGSLWLGHNSIGLFGFYAAFVRIGLLELGVNPATRPSGSVPAA